MLNNSSLKSVVLGLALTGVATVAVAENYRGWNTHSPEYPVSVAMDHFGDLVAERTNDRIILKTYHSAQLGEGEFATEQLQFGALDFGIFSLAPMNNTVKETAVTSLPYAFKSVEHSFRVLEGEIGAEIGKAMEEFNMVPLSWFSGGSRSFYANTPLNSLEDVKGLKFRVQNSEINVAMVEALGANATPLPFGEVYTALQSGVVDGAENNWPSYESTNHFEVAKYYILDQHTIVPEGIIFSKSTWDAFSAEDQAIIKTAAQEAAIYQRELWAVREKKSEQIVRDAGSIIVELDDKTPFIKAMAPVYEKFASDPVIKDLLMRIQAVD
ncbi:TRAP transporter substrate-binding protein [Pseudovibrio sp. Tun.PSC04-5.I4]|uniref:TRAP transporter substrate-binding protein n=1 Tax=Pseudovibrio sp. Tun.PSC04-5.I4 TaxID=1798213 RepID=UPI0008810105|nr:TRAP transporter substrate-binding protein [Pseudovibrio sp. Tun.PSC04-5.I4]SDQ16846.1 tripartite ATP-independent transporter solute receptor, DctP family [Pseudovibrio sp. Tun.PSC04-5.I4]